MTSYEELKNIYERDGHMVFIMAAGVLTQIAEKTLTGDPNAPLIPGNVFSEETKRAVIDAAKKMASADIDVLLAAIQRCVAPISDPKGERIPYLHEHGDIEGICPLCHGELEYLGDQEIADGGTLVSWECPNCGATGMEGSDIVFEHHYNVCDADDKPVKGR